MEGFPNLVPIWVISRARWEDHMVWRLVLKISYRNSHSALSECIISCTVVASQSSKASLSLVRLNHIRIAHPHTCKHRLSPLLWKKRKKKKRLRHRHHFLSASARHSALNNTNSTCETSLPKKEQFECPTTFFLTAVRCFSLMSFLKKEHDLWVGHLHLLAVFQYLPAERSPSLWQNGKRHHT